MKIIPIEQGTPEWLLWRKSKITATDASIIMGTNPFKDPIDCFEDKLGISPPMKDNARMKRGRDLEPEARRLVIEELGIPFEPCCVEDDEPYEFMAASLDGLSLCQHYILEIKCPSIDSHRAAHLEKMIAPYYQTQMQTQFGCSNAGAGFYASYCPEYKEKPLVILEVFPDICVIDDIREKCRDFYENNLCMMCPPKVWHFKAK